MLLAIPTNHVCDHIVQLKQEEMTKKDSDKGLCSLEVSLCSLDKICDMCDLEVLWESLKE